MNNNHYQNMMPANRNKKNSGIALITVMIVVASVSATASWLLYGQNLDTARMTRVLEKEQAVLLALSLEKVAADILKEDRAEQGEQGYDYYATLVNPDWQPSDDDEYYDDLEDDIDEYSDDLEDDIDETDEEDENDDETDEDEEEEEEGNNDEDDNDYFDDEEEEEEKEKHKNQSWSDARQLVEKITPMIGKFENFGLQKTKLCIYDLQAMLNVNNMLLSGQVARIQGVDKVDNSYFDVEENPPARADWYAQRFEELYSRENLDLDEPDIVEFLDNLRDWLDYNDDYRPKGAESSDYSFETPSYRTANGPIASIQELYLIKVFKEFPMQSSGRIDDGDFELGMDDILAYLVALPTDAPNGKRININNAPIAVLATLPYIGSANAEDLYRDIRKAPLRNRKAINKLLKPYIENNKQRQWYKEYLDVQSRFFAAYIELSIGRGKSRTTTRMHSLFYREALSAPYKVYVLERHYIGYNPYEIMARAMSLSDSCYES